MAGAVCIKRDFWMRVPTHVGRAAKVWPKSFQCRQKNYPKHSIKLLPWHRGKLGDCVFEYLNETIRTIF